MMSHYIPPAQAPCIHFFQFSLSPIHDFDVSTFWSLTIHSLPWQTFGLPNPEKKSVVVWPCCGDGKKTTISSGSKSWRTQGHLNIWLDFVFCIFYLGIKPYLYCIRICIGSLLKDERLTSSFRIISLSLTSLRSVKPLPTPRPAHLDWTRPNFFAA